MEIGKSMNVSNDTIQIANEKKKKKQSLGMICTFYNTSVYEKIGEHIFINKVVA